MDWVKWLIPLIALVVWIVASLFRAPKEKEQNQQPKRMPPPGGGKPVEPAQPISDLDRFIQEAKRRRQQQEQHKRTSPPPLLPVYKRNEPPPLIPVVRPVVSSNRPVPPPLPRPQTSPVVELARPMSRPQVNQDEDVIDAVPVEQADKAAGFAAPHQFAYMQNLRMNRESGSELAKHVLEMFRDANSARLALLLREILDRPQFPQRPRGR